MGIDDIRRESDRYRELIKASELKLTTKVTYIQHADRFVRWLAGEVNIWSFAAKIVFRQYAVCGLGSAASSR
jgi:hypothetical protein